MWIAQSRLLAAEKRIRHGFFGRTGGVSEGAYASLNVGLGSDDDRADVAENRRRVAEFLGAEKGLLTLRQVHGRTVLAVEAMLADDARPEADGIITQTHNFAIGALTADCVPILLADAEAGIIAAVHAGWKGALANIMEEAVEQMCARGAVRGRMLAAIGPCIAQESYEVGDELRQAFVQADAGTDAFFAPGAQAGKWMFDTGAVVEARLQALGLGAIERLALDTYALESRFFSFRRSTHRAASGGAVDYGRQVSAITLVA